MRTTDKARDFGCKILYFTSSSESELNKFRYMIYKLVLSIDFSADSGD